jgi:hypothetical protein
MLNSSLVNFNLLIKYVNVIFILLIILILIYLMVNKVKANNFKLKGKYIVTLLSDIRYDGKSGLSRSYFFSGRRSREEILEIALQGLKILIFIVYSIMTLLTVYVYIKYNFSIQLANYCNNVMELHLNTTGNYKIIYTIKTKNSLSEPIEYIQDILGTLIKIIFNYYRTANILLIAPFPIAFKGIIIGVIVRNSSTFFIDLFGTKNKYLKSDGYTFENLFYLYNLSINLMLVTVLLIPLIFWLEKYFEKKIDKTSIDFVELPKKKD